MEDEYKDYSFTGKWSPEITKYNFTQIPNMLIVCQGHLGLTDGELIALVQLMKFWFSHNSSVFPGIKTLAGYSNKGYSTIQKRLVSLEEKGFLKRQPTWGFSSTYDLKYCANKLYQHTKKCDTPLQKRAVRVTKVTRGVPSKPTNEEYTLKKLNFKNTNNVGNILMSKYGGDNVVKI